MANRLPTPPECAVSHKIPIQVHRQFMGTYIPRKKVVRACDRCRVRKTKCSGFSPCTRCQRDGFVCTTERAVRGFRRLSPGDTEVVRETHSALKATIKCLYLMVRNGDAWEFDEPELDDSGELRVHDIVHKLGFTLPSTEAESPTSPTVLEDESISEESANQNKKETEDQAIKEKPVEVLDTGLPTPCQAEQSPPEQYVDPLTDASKASIDHWVGSETLNNPPQQWVDGFYMDFSAPIWGADMMALHWPQSDLISEASGETVSANMPLLCQPLDVNAYGRSNGVIYS